MTTALKFANRVFSALLLAALAGCMSTDEAAERDTLTDQIGIYPPPPAGFVKSRVGVPAFTVTGEEVAGKNLEQFAADQLTTLAFQSGRFAMVERSQLEKLVEEQGLEGIVKAEELAASGEVRGLDYLFVGKVTNLRVKAEKISRGFSIPWIPFLDSWLSGGVDFSKNTTKITAECGVDLRLVDPATGAVMAAHFGEFKRTDSASAIGLDISGWRGNSSAEVNISGEDHGKVLRLALDEALRKMLPSIDEVLVARARKEAPAVAEVSPPHEQPTISPARAVELGSADPTVKFCSSCGEKPKLGAKFCGNCGKNVQP